MIELVIKFGRVTDEGLVSQESTDRLRNGFLIWLQEWLDQNNLI